MVSDGRWTRREVGGGWPPPVPSASPPGLHCVHAGKAVSFFVLLSIGVKMSTVSLFVLLSVGGRMSTGSLSFFVLLGVGVRMSPGSLFVLLGGGVKISPGRINKKGVNLHVKDIPR